MNERLKNYFLYGLPLSDQDVESPMFVWSTLAGMILAGLVIFWVW